MLVPRHLLAVLVPFAWQLVACAPVAPVAPKASGLPPAWATMPAPRIAVVMPHHEDVPGEDETSEETDNEADDGGGDEGEDAVAPPPATPSAALALSDAEIANRFKKDPTSLGPASVGKPSAGALVNGVHMPAGPRWVLLDPAAAWGTQETVDALGWAIDRVHTSHPGAPALPIGHISTKHGGFLPWHRSHQSGRDVDVAYYLKGSRQGFVTATRANLDVPRSYALVKAILEAGPVDMILIDTSVQRLLVEYGVARGEDAAWLDRTYQVRQKTRGAPVRTWPGHKNHLHVRFTSPSAQAMGKRIAPFVAIQSGPPPGVKPPGGAATAQAGAKTPAAQPSEKILTHRARSGDTLVILAKRYGTTVEAIQKANNLKGTALKAGHVYKIPVPAKPATTAPPTPAKPAKAAATQKRRRG